MYVNLLIKKRSETPRLSFISRKTYILHKAPTHLFKDLQNKTVFSSSFKQIHSCLHNYVHKDLFCISMQLADEAQKTLQCQVQHCRELIQRERSRSVRSG